MLGKKSFGSILNANKFSLFFLWIGEKAIVNEISRKFNLNVCGINTENYLLAYNFCNALH